MSGWLIRFSKNGSALIWKRKFFFGLIAIPWALHGGTNIIRTTDGDKEALLMTLEYIKSQDKNADVLLKWL